MPWTDGELFTVQLNWFGNGSSVGILITQLVWFGVRGAIVLTWQIKSTLLIRKKKLVSQTLRMQ
jgi:hypothetical protein